MSIKSYLRRTVFAAFAGLSLAGLSLASLAAGATMLVAIPAVAQAQVSDEFQAALEAYGQWRQDPRWGVGARRAGGLTPSVIGSTPTIGAGSGSPTTTRPTGAG
jgi:hypothetical protein